MDNSAHPIRANRAHPSYFVAANFPQNIGGQANPRPAGAQLRHVEDIVE